MFLKRLETVGFKSFAERITIEFVPGMTVIVGPNGSGKSNVIDAIRWVLGEQSAKSLRGQKMEDIIFQGSETRKQLNFAEVSLILNNEQGQLPIDYQEVNITRRVYRSGDSEFSINKQPCRLKDIVELFMDTGLGRESFSIIGQGKIDEILSSKAEERRAVFEEAAGVLKYKQRKQQAENKLIDTTVNLNRVEDIIHEIKQQIDPLKAQAKKAEKYQELKTLLTKNEITFLISEIAELHEKWTSINEELIAHQDEEIKQSTMIEKREVNLINERRQLQDLDESVSQLQNELVILTELLEQTEGKRKVFIERKKHYNKNAIKLELEHKQLKLQQTEYEERLSKEQKQLRTVSIKLAKNRLLKKEIDKQLSVSVDEINLQIEDRKSEYIEQLNERAVLQNRDHSLTKELQRIERERQRMDEQISEVEEQLVVVKKDEKSHGEQINRYEQELNQLTQHIAAIKQAINDEQAYYENMLKQHYEGNELIAKVRSKKEMLEEMKKSFDGYYYGVKAILQAKAAKQLPNIDGTVVDIINVPEQYLTAIETVLGAQAQHLIVENDAIARDAITWLKRQKKGRATFLPIASLVARSIPFNIQQQLLNEDGYIGIASELVEVESKYDKVVDHLIGNVIITENLSSANKIAQKTGRKYRIVTMDGDIVYPGGSMSGGAKQQAKQTLFTREQEIVRLNNKLVDYEERARAFAKKMVQKQQLIGELEQSANNEEEKVRELKNKLQTIKPLQNELIIQVNRLVNKRDNLRLQEEQLSNEVSETELEQNNCQKQLSKMIDKITAIEQEIADLTMRAEKQADEGKLLEKELTSIQIANAELEERKKHYEDKIITDKQQLDEIKRKLTVLTDEIAQNKLFTKEENEADLIEIIEEKRLEREQIIKKINDKQEESKRKSTILTDEETELKALSKQLVLLVNQIQEKEVQVNRLDVALETRLNTLQSEYTITYERASQLYEKTSDIATIKQVVKELKNDIKQLGNVNLDAISEYSRLQERYDFILEQQTDLLAAKNTLYEAIQEMDAEMVKRFSEMFYQIESFFSTTFKQLFGGGRAKLILTEPDDLLTTGIEIIAEPPGKKMKSLGLLSGGERALTAIALLFSILKARPVPFCILDEVDAALDEANVERFAKYLQQFSKESQFIIISHRQGTMEEANALYGVTMQESGVSRLVSVKLTDLVESIT